MKFMANLFSKSKIVFPGQLRVALLVILSFLLNACHSGALAPRGPIAASEFKLTLFAIELMLLVVIPVILMAFWFAWRYRDKAGNTAKYAPEWKHSTRLELVWWSIPCIIILILGTVTWKSTHRLDPYKPLDSTVKPVTVEVISLDWKWLFIYPEYKIATINYLRIPEGTPIDFKITAAAPMNSFIIPQLGGQIYAMTGMTTQLHLQADKPGVYRGFAANYTGIGFANMNFVAEATSMQDFENWVKEVQAKPGKLSAAVFWHDLVPPSDNNPVTYFGSVDAGLFDDVVMDYMMPNMALPTTASDPKPILPSEIQP